MNAIRGLDESTSSRSNSMRVSSIRSSPRRTSRATGSIRSSPNSRTAGASLVARGRRSIARMRATSSRGENGLVM